MKKILKNEKKTQERALRFVYNNYTSNYEELLHLSKLSSLKVRRLSSIALETFKIINKNCPSYLYDLINIKKHQYYFRYSNTTELPQVRTIRWGINSFRYTASNYGMNCQNIFEMKQMLINFQN